MGLLNTAGVLTNETTNFDPATDYVGFYGIFSVDETITFDVENASLVPEPASLGIWAGVALVGAVPAFLRRRRNIIATS